MDEVKQDLRVRHTKQMLKDALLQILKTKSIDKVTVTELCKTAHINRNTFYSHYRTPLDLLLEVEENFSDKVLTYAQEPLQNKDYAEMLRRLCNAIYEDRDLALVLISTSSNGQFMKHVVGSFYDMMMELWSDLDAPKEQLDVMFRFGTGGSYTLLRSWVDEGFKVTPEHVARDLLQLNLALLQGYIGGDLTPEQ